MKISQEINEELKYIFSNVNDWLKFAEAKNGALLAINVGVIITLYGIVTNNDANYYKLLCIPIMVLLFISAIYCLLSFHPMISRLELKNTNLKKNHNIYFFGDIYQMDENKLLDELKNKLGLKDYSPTGADSDLANQIICNSKIAMQKYNTFKKGIDWVLYALGYSIIAIILMIIF